jgi:formate dehydrogenase maturation protein FdhE
MKRGIAVSLVAIGIAGCGGDDGPTKKEFAANADKICSDIQRQGESIGQSQPDSLQEVATIADRAEKAVRDGVSRLEKLERPSGDAGKQAKEFVDTLKTELDTEFVPALRELKSAAQEKDAKGLRTAAEKLQKLDTSKSEKLARDLGATACAE